MQFEGLERKNAVESESRNIRQAGVEGSLPDPAATPHKPQEPNQCDTKRPTRADGVKERRGASEKPSEGVGMHKNRGNIYRGKLEKSSRVEDDWERQSDEDRAVWHGYDGTSARPSGTHAIRIPRCVQDDSSSSSTHHVIEENSNRPTTTSRVSG